MKVKFNEGDRVFAKVRGYPYWPARIVGPIDEAAALSKMKYEIVFYGTGEKAVVKADDVQPYLEKRHELGKPKKQKAFNDAMAEIESELYPEDQFVAYSSEASEETETVKVHKSPVGRPPKRSSVLPCTPGSDKVKTPTTEPKQRGRKRKTLTDGEMSQDMASKVVKTVRAKKQSLEQSSSAAGSPKTIRKKKSILDDRFEFEFQGKTVIIPLDINRPLLHCQRSIVDWQEIVTEKASALKNSILQGELNVEEAIEEMGDYTKRIAEQKKDEYRYNSQQFKILKVEGRILQLDVKIRTSLTLAKGNIKEACKLIDEFKTLPVTALMLKKHPGIVDTFRRLVRYVGNTSAWNMNEEEKEDFTVEALTVRNKAQQALDKIEALFDIPDGQTFHIFFSEELRHFSKAVETLSQEDFFSLIEEPSQD